MAIIKKKNNKSLLGSVEKGKLNTFIVNVSKYHHYGNQCGSSSKNNE
jgi:hypothetical protein